MKRLIETKIISNTDRERELLEAHYSAPYATPGSAGIDLLARITEPYTLEPGQNFTFPTGIAVNLTDPNLVALIMGRSGMGRKFKIRPSNCVGVCDSDFQDELGAILHNDSDTPYTVQPYDKIAQLLFMPVVQVDLRFVDTFSTVTARGLNGFGHSGR